MKSRKRRWSLAIRYILLLLGGAVSVMPMIYMLSTSLRPNGALYEFPPHFFPKLSEITLENYRYIFAQEKFYLNFLNSVIVALVTIVLAAIIATALAYCLARFEFPGKKLLFALVIGMMIIPGTTLIIPQFQLASFFGITNSLAGLIPFYVAWVIPFSTFMIKSYIEGIPREFDEAADVDGCTGWKKFWYITLPSIRPTILFALVMLTIGGFNVFTSIKMITDGKPMHQTDTVLTWMYYKAFSTGEFGYAAALSFIVAVTLMVLAFLQFRAMKRQNG